VTSFTRQIAVDYASEDIRVNAVSPGFTDTPLLREDTHDGTRQYAEHNTPMQRIGRAEEVADTIVYLLSDAASFITGENILVDGGYTTG
jgi:NAD(P)-dependent dehydrogenase (short-subunit alcohol dehydrogenase family)